ncbi:MAG: DUF72 domain-containing protein [Hyphomicrobiaceae bacterium]
MAGEIRIGIGGWTFEPWRGVFYPPGLVQKKELHFASRALNSIEINGTYYSTFKEASWCNWRDETPDDFVFSVKASRYVTNRKDLTTAGEAVDRFLGQGLTALGTKLGPINWQFMGTKKFDGDEMAGFLKLLPRERDGVVLRHAIEARHESFRSEEFSDLVRKQGIAVVLDHGSDFPEIDIDSAPFRFARFMATSESEDSGVTDPELKALTKRVKGWAKTRDVFAYFISGAKVRNPAAAKALLVATGVTPGN